MNEILSLLSRHGSAIVFVVAFLEQIGAPVPAIPVIIVAGAVAANSGAPILPLLGLVLAGALIADTIWFFLGKRYGYRVLGVLCRISLSPDSCVRQTESFFDQWGLRSLVFAKFIPGFSIVAPPLAGALPNSSYRRFLIYDGLGALVWGGASLLAGVIFRDAIDRLLEALARLGGWAVFILGAGLGLFILWKWWERRRFYLSLRLARITVPELRERIRDQSSLVILDVRTSAAQKRDPRRIPGAILVSPDDMDEHLRNIDVEKEIILYCT